MLKVTAFTLFAAVLGAEAAAAQTMTLTSPDIAPGARIADERATPTAPAATSRPHCRGRERQRTPRASRSRFSILTRRRAAGGGARSSSTSRLT
jgi:hypothetical protein